MTYKFKDKWLERISKVPTPEIKIHLTEEEATELSRNFENYLKSTRREKRSGDEDPKGPTTRNG